MRTASQPSPRRKFAPVFTRLIATCLWLFLPADLLPAGNGAPPTFGSLSVDLETSVKAMDIFNFGRVVEWPSNSDTLRICVTGHGDLGALLQELAKGKSVGGHAVTVNPVVASAPADSCEILVIERSELKHMKSIVQSLAGKPILTVCDDPIGLGTGVIIVFRLIDETIRFQINQQAAEKAGLKISSQLLKLAIATPDAH